MTISKKEWKRIKVFGANVRRERVRRKFTGAWLTYPLKDEDAITAAMESHEHAFASYKQAEAAETQRVQVRARNIGTLLTVLFFGIAIILLGCAAYLFFHNRLPH